MGVHGFSLFCQAEVLRTTQKFTFNGSWFIGINNTVGTVLLGTHYSIFNVTDKLHSCNAAYMHHTCAMVISCSAGLKSNWTAGMYLCNSVFRSKCMHVLMPSVQLDDSCLYIVSTSLYVS